MSGSKKALVVFEGYPTEDILSKGGSFSWRLDPDKAKQCDYLICCCSTQGSELRGSAFLIGKISDVIPSPEEIAPDRWMIKFSEYAIINIANVWKGWQNPVHYLSDEENQEIEEKLGKSLDELDFQPVIKSQPKTAVAVFEGNPTETILSKGGSFSWVLNRDVAKECRYLICCCSTPDSELRGSAFLIGKISDVVPSPDPEKTTQKRWMIEFSEYAIVNIPNVWKKWQNPVHYFDSEEIRELEEKLGKSLDELDFQPVMKAKEEPKPGAESE